MLQMHTEEVCACIFIKKINFSAKLILRITVKEIIWTCVQFNFKLNM